LPLLLVLVLQFEPERYHPVSFALIAVQILLFMLSIALVRKETVAKNKPIFVNFAIFFGLQFLFYLEYFVGGYLKSRDGFFPVYFNQYLSLSAYFFLLAVALVYVTLDALLRDYSTKRKYALTLAIVGGFFLLYFHPYIVDPKHAHRTPEILDYKVVSNAAEHLPPWATAEDIAFAVELRGWDGNEPGELLPAGEELQRVESLRPFLEEENYIFLVYGQLYRNDVYMSVLCIVFVLMFFGYQYMKDPPQGAYIEKIMFLFLLFSSLEALHAWSFVKTMEVDFAREMFDLGNYMSLGILFPITLYFSARLHFIASIKGEYYEQEVATRPAGITRWRDAMDDLIIDRFFNRKAIIGRMLVDPNRK